MNQLIQIMMMALTVAMEAAGESYQGKLAVAYVIRNRAKHHGTSYTDVVLRSMQFSCWNTASSTRMNLDLLPELSFAECLKASIAAAYLLEPDPTLGAEFYLNEAVVISSAGKLPDWWFSDTYADGEIKIGNHTFRPPKLTQKI